MKIFLYFIIPIAFISCTREIELEQPDYTPQITVDGYIESGDFAHIYLTRSSPFLTSYDSVSIRNTFLNNAKITLTSSGGYSEILTLFKEKSFFPPFVYKSVKIKGVAGDTFSLKVELGGKIITASTTIPASPKINEVYLEALNDTTGILKLKIQPSVSETERLYIQVKSKRADKNYHPAKIPIFLIPASSTAEVLTVSRSRETNFYLTNLEKEPYYKWPRYEYAIDDTVFLKVGMIDVESYQVLKSIFDDQTSMENPFAFNRVGIQSNINGGIGRWTGIGVAPIEVYTKEKVRIKP
jgi:Domain of unknown function (DUF4249)